MPNLKISYEGADVLICANGDTTAFITLNKKAEDIMYAMSVKDENIDIGTLRTVFGLTFYGDACTLTPFLKEKGLTYYHGHI